MPPAPAKIASTPRQSSRTCWNPAVPPPPAPGGAAGNESGGWLGGGLALAGGALDGGALDAGALDAWALAGGALDAGALVAGALGVGVLGVGVPLAEPVGVAGPPGENEGGVVGGVLDEQADTDAVPSMAKAAQPRTVPRRRRRP
jgi:hypothetical protein